MPSQKPRNAIVILLDSLNRHMLGAYGGTEFKTPNLDRFAARSQRFTNHYTGSLPCMPARHDILCGSLDFLWRAWGSVDMPSVPVYEPGDWGPMESVEWMAGQGRTWFDQCPVLT